MQAAKVPRWDAALIAKLVAMAACQPDQRISEALAWRDAWYKEVVCALHRRETTLDARGSDAASAASRAADGSTPSRLCVKNMTLEPLLVARLLRRQAPTEQPPHGRSMIPTLSSVSVPVSHVF